MSAFLQFHVALSLVGLLAGVVVLFGLLTGSAQRAWTAIFLASTFATSLTGFGLPAAHILPSHIVGAISVVVLAVAIFARYARSLEGRWRAVYIITALLGFYLNAFVAVVQAFLKIDFLRALAPTQSELPFVIVQGVLLLAFVGFVILALRRVRKTSGYMPTAGNK